MATGNDVFKSAMSLSDNLSSQGQAVSADSREYQHRTLDIINGLLGEIRMLLGEEFVPITALTDEISDNFIALSVLPYGLAANLLAEESDVASFYEQRYEELLARYIASRPGEITQITNFYGSLEHGEFSRW